MENIEYSQAYQTYFPYVLKLTTKVLGNYFDAQDVTADVFLYLYEESLKKTNLRDKQVKWWLAVTAKHTASRYRRTFYKFDTVELNEENDRYVADLSFEDTSINKLFARDALRMLSKHKPEWCAMLYYSVMFEKSYKEIAEHYGVPTSEIKSNIHRARKYLKASCHITSDEILNTYIAFAFGTELVNLVSNFTKFS